MRAATHADIPTLMAMCEADSNAPQWTCNAYERLLVRSAEGSSVVRVAVVIGNQTEEQQERIIGFYAAEAMSPADTEWELENILVNPHDRRQGAGSLLMRDLLAHVRVVASTRLLLEVRASNAAARRLYENFGFQVVGERPGYYRCPVESALLYALEL